MGDNLFATTYSLALVYYWHGYEAALHVALVSFQVGVSNLPPLLLRCKAYLNFKLLIDGETISAIFLNVLCKFCEKNSF